MVSYNNKILFNWLDRLFIWLHAFLLAGKQQACLVTLELLLCGEIAIQL